MTIPAPIVRRCLDVYTLLALVLSTGAFLTVFIGSNNPSAIQQGSPVYTVLWGLVYAISLLRFIRQRHRAMTRLRANRALVLLVVLCFASILWSMAPFVTLHAAATLFFTALFALDMSLRYSIRQQLQLICIALVSVVLMSIIAEVVFPGAVPGRDFEESAWHGVFGFKNDFGKVTCLCVIACLSLSSKSTLLRLAIVASGLVVTVLSRSVSATGYTLLFGIAFVGVKIFKWKPKPRRIALALIGIFLIAIANYAIQNFVHLTSQIGKDPHLTGRTELWKLAAADIRRNPVIGYGYLAFWSADSPPARRIREEINWADAPHSHNGYIETLLSLGVFGITAYALVYAGLVRRAYRYFIRNEKEYARWPITYMMFLFVYQLTESSVIVGNGFDWILLCGLAFSLPALSYCEVGQTPEPDRQTKAA
jgi:exopolysaccharide production protein ExoQ